jgi:hypothetical protein
VQLHSTLTAKEVAIPTNQLPKEALLLLAMPRAFKYDTTTDLSAAKNFNNTDKENHQIMFTNTGISHG